MGLNHTGIVGLLHFAVTNTLWSFHSKMIPRKPKTHLELSYNTVRDLRDLVIPSKDQLHMAVSYSRGYVEPQISHFANFTPYQNVTFGKCVKFAYGQFR